MLAVFEILWLVEVCDSRFFCGARNAMDVFPLSLSGPASAMLLAMGMSPVLPLGVLTLWPESCYPTASC